MQDKFSEILKKYNSYHPNPKSDTLEKAYELANVAYFGEKRISGNPWMLHVLGTADTVADLQMDTSSLAAALLHDAPKFGLTVNEVKNELNEEVAHILNNLDSIKKIKGKYKGEYSDEGYAEYLRRLILSTSSDLRAVLIRIAEKYNSLSTLKELPQEIQKDSIEKALKIYAPLADYIGANELKSKIEELVFKYKHPKIYKKRIDELNSHTLVREKKLEDFISELRDILNSDNSSFDKVEHRLKAPYSYHRKVKRYVNKYKINETDAVEKVRDKVAFRIVTSTIKDCYSLLDIIHGYYKHDPDDFDDYIDNPKPNGYQSLQTSIELEEENFVEIQIKTKEMHEHSSWGPASHYFYKVTGGSQIQSSDERKIEVLKQLLTWKDKVFHDKTGADIEDIEDYIFVFTPKGDIIELPKSSTPVDFAYAVHTELGDKIIRSKVNEKQVRLSTKLKNGDIVEIFTDKNRKGPKREWLDFVKSKEARINIKKWLNKSRY